MSELKDCIFCLIGLGVKPGEILATSLDAYALTPLNPVTPGHTLIIPYAHRADFTEDPDISGRAMSFASWYASEHIKGDVNLITSKGRDATQSVLHLHLHLVPRVANDGLALPWQSGGR